MSNKIAKISPLGKIILQRLKDQNFTKQYLADEMGIHRHTLSNWISGDTEPSHTELETMSKILDINLSNRSFEDQVITRELWDQLKKNNDKFQQEIDRLWDQISQKDNLINRLIPPGDGIQSVPTKNG